jgi:repressor LexA
MELTARQLEILKFIENELDQNGLPPTRSEIMVQFGFASPNAAQCHLRALAKHGAIELHSHRARGIVPKRSQGKQGLTNIPIIGRVAAGTPVLAVENHEDDLGLDIGAFRPTPDYALKVKGDSMIDAGILDQDLLLVHRTPEAHSGQIVVARLGEEVTVKRLRRRGRGTWLEPANPDYPVIQIKRSDDFAIEGLGVGVIRSRLE